MLPAPNDLTYFLEICHTLNFSRASERLGISQPSLSVAIKRLEHLMGIELFTRHKNGVKLTPAGKHLSTHAKQILQDWTTLKAESLATHYEVQGSFKLGCHQSLALHSVANLLPPLLKKYPKLAVNLIHDLSRNIVEGVVELTIDAGIVINPIKHPDLIIQKLASDSVTFWSSDLIKGKPSTINTIICDPNLMQTQWLLKKLSQTRIKYKRLITSSSLEVIAKLTASSAGVGILPECVVSAVAPKKLKALAKLPIYDDEICLVYRPEKRDIKALQVILHAIKSYFKD